MLLDSTSKQDEERVRRFVNERHPELFQALRANDIEILGTRSRDRWFLFIGVLTGSLFAFALSSLVLLTR